MEWRVEMRSVPRIGDGQEDRVGACERVEAQRTAQSGSVAGA
ncbi:MAG: hypothetical protein ACLUFV_08840 [Acutalibacteraceae bacterium]